MNTSLLKFLLRPIVSWALENKFGLDDIIETVKCLLVKIAAEKIGEAGQLPSDSRISLMTGVHRSDVARLKKGDLSRGEKKHDVMTRLYTVWSQDRRFCSEGTPRALSFQGEESELFSLVRAVTKELSPYSVLLELDRLGVVRYENDTVLLLASDYSPKGDTSAHFDLLGTQIEDLLACVTQNLEENSPLNLHLTTYFDNIRDDSLEFVREYLLREGTELHDKVRKMLSERDLDITPSTTTQGGNRVSLTAFSVIHRRREPLPQPPKRKPGRKKRRTEA